VATSTSGATILAASLASASSPTTPSAGCTTAVTASPNSWFKLLTERRLRRGVFNSVDALIDAIETWAERWNDDPKPFIWRKTTGQIIEKVRRGRTALTEANPRRSTSSIGDTIQTVWGDPNSVWRHVCATARAVHGGPARTGRAPTRLPPGR
jgi:hypothetical protein